MAVAENSTKGLLVYLRKRLVRRSKKSLARVRDIFFGPSHQLEAPPSLPMVKPNENWVGGFEDVRCLGIADRFSAECWSFEFDYSLVDLESWEAELDHAPELLLVESTWEGPDGQYRGLMAGRSSVDSRLADLVLSCREKGIPTVFWNKEDPLHFDDFIATAKHFEYIGTTAQECVSKYQEFAPDAKVFVMPFAAQPAIHNPIGTLEGARVNDVSFAGTYYSHKWEKRREQMDVMFDAASNLAGRFGYHFQIFSRHSGGERRYQFPSKWADFVKPRIDYLQVVELYRTSKVVLNVNSSVESDTMVSRRVIEALACGAAVVSGKSKGLTGLLGHGLVPEAEGRREVEALMRALLSSVQLRRKLIHRAQREIWANHTYRDRAAMLLRETCSHERVGPQPVVSVISVTKREKQIAHLLDQVTQQQGPTVELLVCTHGFSPELVDDEIKRRSLPDSLIRVKVLSASEEETLGDCLNRLLAEVNGDFVAKFDDDDYYLENYLQDQLNSLKFTQADIVGKSSIYFFLEEPNLMVKRWPHEENKWTNFVSGATLVARTPVIQQLRFASLSKGEDSDLLARAAEEKLTIYSSDSYNFIATRHKNRDHTWDISDLEILAYSVTETAGLNLDHVRA